MAFSYSKKFIAVFLVLCLVFVCIVPAPPAHASVGIAIGFAAASALAAYGLIPVFSGYSMSQANDYWTTQVENYCNAHQIDPGDIMEDVLMSQSILRFGDEAAAFFNAFTADYVSSNNIGSTSSVVETGTYFSYSTCPEYGSTGAFPVGFVPPYYQSVSFGNTTFTLSMSGTNAVIKTQSGSTVLSDPGYSSTVVPAGIIFTHDASGNIFMRITYFSSAYNAYTYSKSKYFSVNSYRSPSSVSASVAPEFPQRIAEPARAIFIPSGYLDSSGYVNLNPSVTPSILEVSDSYTGYYSDTGWVLPDGTVLDNTAFFNLIDNPQAVLDEIEYLKGHSLPPSSPSPSPGFDPEYIEDTLTKAAVCAIIGCLLRNALTPHEVANYISDDDTIILLLEEALDLSDPEWQLFFDSVPQHPEYNLNPDDVPSSSDDPSGGDDDDDFFVKLRNLLIGLFHLSDLNIDNPVPDINVDIPEVDFNFDPDIDPSINPDIDPGLDPDLPDIDPDIDPDFPGSTPNYHGGWLPGLLDKLGILSILDHISVPWAIVQEWISSIGDFLDFFASFLSFLPRAMVLPFYGLVVASAIIIFVKRFIG